MNTTEQNWKILVVDDQEINLKILKNLLEKNGYEVITAPDGYQAKELAESEHPDLVLLDIMMPGESGLDTCARLKSDPGTTDIQVIFLSALEDITSKVEGFNVGGVDYVTKPFQNEEILARVKTHLKLKYAYQRIIQEQAERLRHVQKAQEEILVDPSDLPEANYGVCYYPLQEAGGDFYDVFKMGEEIFGYFLGDISGHDIHASFNTAALKALVRQNFDPLHSSVESMSLINRILTILFSDEQHLTAAYVHLDRSSYTLSFVSAAHPPMIYVSAHGDTREVNSEGDLMGIFRAAYFETISMNGNKGDRFYLYSDGLLDSINKDVSRNKSISQLKDSCEKFRNTDIQAVPFNIVHDLVSDPVWKAQDDILLMAVEL